eukprot:TRINITY_DN13561_c0_g1_i1.p1 TRINITY_DN13561_c0_g1~~TRINITY_DN13561_c0_g1_i1.p1  ORF type:complete len:66 (+),score=3.57 TRINITY_DN13561_c0_g1_i1:240-437(+)
MNNSVSVAFTVFDTRTGSMHTPLPSNTFVERGKRRAPDVTAFYSNGSIYVILFQVVTYQKTITTR